MEFTVMQRTIGGMYLLKGQQGGAIAKPIAVFDEKGKKQIGKIVETIGRVKEPFYLAVLAGGEQLIGKTITAEVA